MRVQLRVTKTGTRSFKISVKQGNEFSKKSIKIPKSTEEIKKLVSELTEEFKSENFAITDKQLYTALQEKSSIFPNIVFE